MRIWQFNLSKSFYDILRASSSSSKKTNQNGAKLNFVPVKSNLISRNQAN